ncbi:Phosphatidylserine decarboxylase proenzyme 1, mitochondrial [Fulvia fulva]|uniref:Phosphatidylserine decarboxylase proenzyme 1, mitochondrial n=1 Tax=Passalora fulva TaxID=5499 RepID=A0A9Q8P628_PASFU|nr:Phosphatidylserine decarboxylase proenzyme 1, mitochondrial [Fulvia fulva]UJO14387.1 Phosphatidylserine decarboxylase proenzyme 1, mitochondrial [Fulvia fulva]
MPPTTATTQARLVLPSRTFPSQHPRYTRSRPFASTHRASRQEGQHRKSSFSSRAREALRATPIVWKPIPIGLGIAFLGAFQLYRINERERRKDEARWRLSKDEEDDEFDTDVIGRPKPRPRIRPSGPWSVTIMSTLPLKALSRWWGWFNSIDIPMFARVPGFKLYGWAFGVNFDEIEEEDLKKFRNLSEFFYRTLKPGVRPLDPHPNALSSPADGRIVQFGLIEHGEVEQVKGVTYSVDALLGAKPTAGTPGTSNIPGTAGAPKMSKDRTRDGDEEILREDEEFARINGISYNLPSLLSGAASGKKRRSWWKLPKSGNESDPKNTDPKLREGGSEASIIPTSDQSTKSAPSSEQEVARDLASREKPWYAPAEQQEVPTALYYCVVYLAPGDYHRFHSPVSWVVESRRHFAGELYSVSPFLVKNLPGLFTLNERVALLGRWKYGFFSYTPVGATNVGSIVINFDRELRTNSLLTDTLADKAAEEASERGEPYSGYAEATYTSASKVLGGHALRRGEEMGGFQLGSTIVMVFEAPKGRRPTFDEGFTGTERRGGWKWCIENGKKVQVGEKLGFVDHPEDEGR